MNIYIENFKNNKIVLIALVIIITAGLLAVKSSQKNDVVSEILIFLPKETGENLSLKPVVNLNNVSQFIKSKQFDNEIKGYVRKEVGDSNQSFSINRDIYFDFFENKPVLKLTVTTKTKELSKKISRMLSKFIISKINNPVTREQIKLYENLIKEERNMLIDIEKKSQEKVLDGSYKLAQFEITKDLTTNTQLLDNLRKNQNIKTVNNETIIRTFNFLEVILQGLIFSLVLYVGIVVTIAEIKKDRL